MQSHAVSCTFSSTIHTGFNSSNRALTTSLNKDDSDIELALRLRCITWCPQMAPTLHNKVCRLPCIFWEGNEFAIQRNVLVRAFWWNALHTDSNGHDNIEKGNKWEHCRMWQWAMLCATLRGLLRCTTALCIRTNVHALSAAPPQYSIK